MTNCIASSRGGHDPLKVYNAYKRAMEHRGGPTVILAQTVKGYGLGVSGSAQRDPSGEEADRSGAHRLPLALLDSDSRRRRARRLALSPARRQSRDRLHAGAPRGTRRLSCPTRNVRRSDFKAPALDHFAESLAGSQGPRRLYHHGLRQHAAAAAEGSRDRQADRAHHSRRSPHLRHGIDHPPGRHLRQPGPALQAARSGHAALLPRGEERPDSGGRHHRSGLDGVVHRGGHGLLRTTACR